MSRRFEIEHWFKQVWGTKPYKHREKHSCVEQCLVCETIAKYKEYIELPEEKEEALPQRKVKHRRDIAFEKLKDNMRKAQLFKRQQQEKKEEK